MRNFVIEVMIDIIFCFGGMGGHVVLDIVMFSMGDGIQLTTREALGEPTMTGLALYGHVSKTFLVWILNNILSGGLAFLQYVLIILH